jgi:hypothetical protein
MQIGPIAPMNGGTRRGPLLPKATASAKAETQNRTPSLLSEGEAAMLASLGETTPRAAWGEG